MPIYEYRCEECGHQSEELQKMSDAPLTECPVCGGPYKKLISAPAFQFKGSGWYVTDYARKGGGPSGESSGGGSSSGGASSDKSSSGSGGSGDKSSEGAKSSKESSGGASQGSGSSKGGSTST